MVAVGVEGWPCGSPSAVATRQAEQVCLRLRVTEGEARAGDGDEVPLDRLERPEAGLPEADRFDGVEWLADDGPWSCGNTSLAAAGAGEREGRGERNVGEYIVP